MTKVSVLLPDELHTFVEERVADQGYGSSGGYIRELIERDRENLRALLLEGARSPQTQFADENYFSGLRDRIDNHGSE